MKCDYMDKVVALGQVYEINIGKKVSKDTSIGGEKKKKVKPFKSGFKLNTVKGIITHPILNTPAYIFEEDDSYVECRRCRVIN